MQTRQISVPGISSIDLAITQIIGDDEPWINQSEPHIHGECEIYINLSGDVSFDVEGRLYPVSRGSVVITRPYEYHRCICHSRQRHDHIWITFSAERSEEYLQIFFDREKGHRNLIVLEEAELNTLQAQIDALERFDGDPLQQRIRVLKLFAILNKSKQAVPTTSPEKMPPDVMAALAYMEEHLSEELDLRVLAEVSNVSVNTLERHFKQSIGTLPAQTLRQKRLFASLAYLRAGQTVADAAAKCGFSDYSPYIQMFRKQFGITPFKYKKNFKRQ